MFRFNSQQLESRGPDIAISERGTWNKMIELNNHTFIFFQQTVDTLVISTRSSNYRDNNSKPAVVSRICKEACSAILGYQTSVNAKAT